MTRMATEYERADHDRDLAKHDRPPLRFTPPISSALETAVQVKGVKDPREAAKLVEQYAQTAIAAARLDKTMARFDRVLIGHPQEIAALKLLGYCEGICGEGLFGEQIELEIRARCAELRVALNMPTREAAHA